MLAAGAHAAQAVDHTFQGKGRESSASDQRETRGLWPATPPGALGCTLPQKGGGSAQRGYFGIETGTI